MVCCSFATQPQAQYVAGAFTPSSDCTPEVKKQIDEVRETWVKDWNAKNLDGVITPYSADATFLSADGTRDTGKTQIQAALQKQIGSTVTVTNLKPGCSTDLA